MATRTIDPTGQKDNLILTGAAMALVATTVGGIWVSLHLAAYLDQTRIPTRDPLRLAVELVTGRQPWSPTATLVGAALAVLVLVLVVAVVLLWPKSSTMRPDRSARRMGSGHDLTHLTAAGGGGQGEAAWLDRRRAADRKNREGSPDAVLLLGGHGGDDRRPPHAKDHRLRGPRRPGRPRRMCVHLQQARPPRRHPPPTPGCG